MKVMQNIKEFITENSLLIVLFVFALFFFLLQHYFQVSWDFVSYILNARYLFGDGSYFEVYRAPLTSFILGILLFLGKAAEYIFIIFVVVIHLYSIIKLSDALYNKCLSKYKINKQILRFLFYLFSLSPFVLGYGLLVGTELLALSFFQLFLGCFIEDKKSGVYLALAVLTRYNFLLFFPLLFFNKRVKKILINIGLFLLILFPWLLYNFIKFGNWFTSIVDSYWLNVISRQNIIQSFNYIGLLSVFTWLLPFFILGIIIFLYNIIKKRKRLWDFKYELLFLLIFILIIFDFCNTPFKIDRYLFNLSLPIAFFSVLGVVFLFKKYKSENFKNIFIGILLIIFIISGSVMFILSYNQRHLDEVYKDVARDLEELNLSGCKTLSPHWVPINYHLEQTILLPYSIDRAISDKQVVVIFPGDETMDDTYVKEELDNYNQLKKTEKYIIFGKENLSNENCRVWEGFDFPMVSLSCLVVANRFEKMKLKNVINNVCEVINFKN